MNSDYVIHEITLLFKKWKINILGNALPRQYGIFGIGSLFQENKSAMSIRHYNKWSLKVQISLLNLQSIPSRIFTTI